jgi:hypothetical protein
MCVRQQQPNQDMKEHRDMSQQACRVLPKSNGSSAGGSCLMQHQTSTLKIDARREYGWLCMSLPIMPCAWAHLNIRHVTDVVWACYIFMLYPSLKSVTSCMHTEICTLGILAVSWAIRTSMSCELAACWVHSTWLTMPDMPDIYSTNTQLTFITLGQVCIGELVYHHTGDIQTHNKPTQQLTRTVPCYFAAWMPAYAVPPLPCFGLHKAVNLSLH